MYLVSSLKKSLTIGVGGHEVEPPLSDLADGCTGVMLVFDNEADAQNYALEVNARIYEMEESKTNDK